MKRTSIYDVWRGKDHPWVGWFKPALFDGLADGTVLASEDEPYRSELPPGSELDTSWVPEDAAVLIDVPGEAAVSWALALGRKGLRPVFAINTSSAPSELVPMDAVKVALAAGARFGACFPTGPGLMPAFVLDSRRPGDRGSLPGCFDNRWTLFASDLPSGADLLGARVRRVVLVRQGEVLGDVEEVLREYQRQGLELLCLDVDATLGLARMTLRERGWFGRAIANIRRRVSLTRRADGSYGHRVPIAPFPSHG